MYFKSKYILFSLLGLLIVVTTVIAIGGARKQALLTNGNAVTPADHEIDTSSINYSFNNRNLPIYYVETSEKKVAISFDAAWGAEDFDGIMEILDKHKVKTTFFVTGGWVKSYPDKIKILAEKGHDIGNHSKSHFDMAKISQENCRKEIQEVTDAVFELTGYEMFLFRPPYGSYNNTLIETAYDMDYYPVQWNVDSLDWKDYGPEKIISNVCQGNKLCPGSIVLLHNGATYTREALDGLLTKIEGMGYEIVPISELIYKDHFKMNVDGKQMKTAEEDQTIALPLNPSRR